MKLSKLKTSNLEFMTELREDISPDGSGSSTPKSNLVRNGHSRSVHSLTSIVKAHLWIQYPNCQSLKLLILILLSNFSDAIR